MDLGTQTKTTPRAMPEKTPITGQSVTLEPLSKDHLSELWHAAKEAEASFTYLRYGPFQSKAELLETITDLSSREDQPFWAVRANGSGLVQGWLSLCDIYQQDASIEIGSIWFSPSLQRTRAATEAMFLLMRLAMDELAYERLVWRCQAQNDASFRAAERLGFTYEGTWRHAAIIDGWQRDIAWFSILSEEWQSHRKTMTEWLDDRNFDHEGHSLKSMQTVRSNAAQI